MTYIEDENGNHIVDENGDKIKFTLTYEASFLLKHKEPIHVNNDGHLDRK